jgi:hypothetical protein
METKVLNNKINEIINLNNKTSLLWAQHLEVLGGLT